jgi:aldose 1-epimerase
VLDYSLAGKQVVAGDEPKHRQAYRSSLLAPWPNRVAGGRWTWEGQQLQLPVNEPSVGAALHGLVVDAEFDVVEAGRTSVLLVHNLAPTPGYPFQLRIEASYVLTGGGLVCSLVAHNTDVQAVPVALGVHPYLDCRGLVDDIELMLPAATLVVGDRSWRETGRVAVDDTDLDFRVARRVGKAVIDACWTGLPEGTVRAVVQFPDGDSVEVWGGSTCRYVVIYNADTLPGTLRRRSIAVEPCTAPANAFQSGTDLDVLPAGESLTLEWGLRPSWLA